MSQFGDHSAEEAAKHHQHKNETVLLVSVALMQAI